MKKIFLIISYLVYFYPVRLLLRLAGYERSIYLAERLSIVFKIFAKKKIERMRKNYDTFFDNLFSDGNLDRIISKFLKNSAKLIVNRLFFDRISGEKCSAISDFQGIENIYAALSLNKGAIIAFCHNGSHTLALHCLGATTGKPVHAYTSHEIDKASFLSNNFFSRKIIELHKMSSFSVLHQKGLKEFYRSLKSNEITAMAFDSQRGDRVIDVQLGSCRVKIPEGIFRVSLRSGAPLIPFFSSYKTGLRINVYIEEPIIVTDIQEAADSFMKKFETFLLEHPQDWGGWLRLRSGNDEKGPYFRLLKDKLLF